MDKAREEDEIRAGFDLSWKPSPKLELSMSVLPDFGAVEADNVVLNLTAFEIYFPEKRLFFLEGNEIFNSTPRSNPGNIIRTTTNDNFATTSRKVFSNSFVPTPISLMNTRRIGGTANQVTVRNGGVRGFGSYGIHLQDDCRITGVTVKENGSSGIDVGSGCVIRDTVVSRNGFYGIDATESEIAWVGRAIVLVSNVASGNQDDGLAAASGAVFIGNGTYENGEDGLECGFACAMHENSSYQNEDDGIHSNAGSSITRNSTKANGGYGIFSVVNGAGFGFNAVSTTTGSAGTTSGGINLGNNVCNGGAACP